MCVMQYEYLILSNNNNALVNKCKTQLIYYIYGAHLVYPSLVK